MTLELAQAICGWFDDPSASKPFGVHLTPVLITQGVHARLDNISEGGTWIETEHFEVKWGDEEPQEG